MDFIEANFDGLIGPMHNYAGLSVGNLAATASAGAVSHPRAAALQGLQKMRRVMELGVVQGVLPPPLRPAAGPLRPLGFRGSDDEALVAAAAEDPALFVAACSASSMWTANAATVVSERESGDGRTHIVVANLASMLHRSLEADETCATLRRAFPDPARFAVHPPLRPGAHFPDEGAANHMRLAGRHDAAGVDVFVHGGERGGRFPERQARRASQAVARLAGARRPVFALQSKRAIEAGAFHNDVVAVSNENLLLAHAEAFEDKGPLYETLAREVPGFLPIEIDGIDLPTAVRTYLFNSQLVTLPEGGMALVLPAEAREHPGAWAEVERLLRGNTPIREAVVVDLRESMRNGGGPACLRLRVPMSEATLAAVDPRFLLTPSLWDRLAAVVERTWPERIAPTDLPDPALWAEARRAHAILLQAMGLAG